ncbi:hypothetical protein ACWC0C_06985 [Streptomyces sp. NPDC001709]
MPARTGRPLAHVPDTALIAAVTQLGPGATTTEIGRLVASVDRVGPSLMQALFQRLTACPEVRERMVRNEHQHSRGQLRSVWYVHDQDDA